MLRQSIGKYGTHGNSGGHIWGVNVCINFNTFRLREAKNTPFFSISLSLFLFVVCSIAVYACVREQNEHKKERRKKNPKEKPNS